MEDKVIVTLKGKPIVTQKDLEEEKEYWSQDPQLQDCEDEDGSESYLKSEAFVHNCLDGLIRRKIADEYVLAHKINETPEYQKQLSQTINNLHRRILNEAINVPVTEDELHDLYEDKSRYFEGSFEESRKIMEDYLKKINFSYYLGEKIEELKKEYDVKINEDLVK